MSALRKRIHIQTCLVWLSSHQTYHIFMDLSPSKRAILQSILESKGVEVYRPSSMLSAYVEIFFEISLVGVLLYYTISA